MGLVMGKLWNTSTIMMISAMTTGSRSGLTLVVTMLYPGTVTLVAVTLSAWSVL